jgi:hypothetical protein
MTIPNVDNYFEQPVGGSTDNKANFGGTVNFGGEATVGSATFTFTAGAANVAEVAIALVDGAGVAVASGQPFNVWLSDAATGVGLTATSASGTVTAKSASGAVFGTLTAKKALVVQPLATGIFTLEITDTAKTTFYVAVQNPATGQVVVSRIMATGDYGA